VHNKPQGCGASGASADGPSEEEEEEDARCIVAMQFTVVHRATYFISWAFCYVFI
jgi:hypothetical protein